MFHSHPALVDAMRVDTYRRTTDHHGVPGDDFDGVVPHSLRTRQGRKAARRDER